MFPQPTIERGKMKQGAQSPGRRSAARRRPGPSERLLIEAIELHRSGRLELAERAYRRYLARHRNHAPALQNLGLLLHQRGDFAGARATIRRAIEHAPDAASCRESLGRVLRAQGDLRGASAAFREALEREPGLADARYQLGTVHHDLEELDEAAECYRRVVADVPEHVPAWNSLGSTHLDRGELEEAESCLRRALGLDPNHVPARLNLAVTLQRGGRLDDAEEMLQALVREPPGLAEAHANLALLYRERGMLAEAESAAHRALALRPDSASDHFVLAEIAIARGKPGMAIESYRRCVALEPRLVKAWLRLGATLIARADVPAGVEAAHRVLALDPENAAALNLLAHASSIAGDRKAAEAYCLRSLEISPDLPLAWSMLAHLRRFSEADRETIARVESIPERRALGDEDRCHLHFALGRMHHDCRHHERAFAHFERANRIHRRRREFDLDEWVRRIDAIIETFDAECFARTRGYGDPNPQPVFVFGMPRSGTSLVEQILSSHPAVHGAGELNAMPECARRLGAAAGAGPQDYPRAAGRVEPDTARQVAAQYLDMLRRDCAGAERITDKLPGNYSYLGLIALLLPGARLVHCRRSPLDVCLSNYMQHYGDGHVYSYDLRELGLVYRQYERIMRHWREVLPIEIHEVVYEDVVMDQERQSREIVAFCGLAWDPACLDFFAGERAVATASQWQVRRPIYRSALDRWKHYEAHLGELRLALGDVLPA